MPLFAGLFWAAEPLHGLHDWVEAIRQAAGIDMTPAKLIQYGAFIIGIRGAL